MSASARRRRGAKLNAPPSATRDGRRGGEKEGVGVGVGGSVQHATIPFTLTAKNEDERVGGGRRAGKSSSVFVWWSSHGPRGCRWGHSENLLNESDGWNPSVQHPRRSALLQSQQSTLEAAKRRNVRCKKKNLWAVSHKDARHSSVSGRPPPGKFGHLRAELKDVLWRGFVFLFFCQHHDLTSYIGGRRNILK